MLRSGSSYDLVGKDVEINIDWSGLTRDVFRCLNYAANDNYRECRAFGLMLTSGDATPSEHGGTTDPLCPGILYLDRQIYHEALPYLYFQNTFGFNSVTMLCPWSRLISSKRSIQH